jgi:hypothetical protein
MYVGLLQLFLGGNKRQSLRDWSYWTVGVRVGLAQGEWNSRRIVLTGRDTGEQELLNAAETHIHSQNGLHNSDEDLLSLLEALVQVPCRL